MTAGPATLAGTGLSPASLTAAPPADQGPLAWVYPEIELALAAVAAALQGADWQAAGVRIGVLAHIHQVAGALRMVGLPAEERVVLACETCLRTHEGAPPPAHVAALQPLLAAVEHQLRRRLEGRPVRALDLAPPLAALAQACGWPDEPEALFDPDLTGLPAGRTGAGAPVPGADPATLRGTFQRHLLALLRAPGDGAAREGLSGVLRTVAGDAPGAFGASRWLACAELVAAWNGPPEPSARALLTRIDRQLRTTGLPGDETNDALARAVLWHAARLPAPPPALVDCMRACRVAECLAPVPDLPAEALPPGRVADALARTRLNTALQAASARLETWHLSRQGPLPDALLRDLDEATLACEHLRDDEALQWLAEARTLLQDLPAQGGVADARIEPVADILATLGALADLPPDAARRRLAALRERLLQAAAAVAGTAAPRPAPDDAMASVAAPDSPAQDASGSTSAALLGVFLDEAEDRLAALREDIATLRALGDAQDGRAPVARLRTHLRTLSSSGLVAGLVPLATLCRELDQALASWAGQGAHAWQGPAALVEDSAAAIERWLLRLATGRPPPFETGRLVERARTLSRPAAVPLDSLISLQDIFLEEAGERLRDLREALAQPLAPEAARRAAHTLAGIARTAGHPGMATLAQALETLLTQHRSAPHDPDPATPVLPASLLQEAAAALTRMHADLQAGHPLQPQDALVRALQRELQPLHGELEDPSTDQPDPDLLPVFLEEVADLLPRLQRDLQACREGHDPVSGAVPLDGAARQGALDSLRRGLHTLKGSARMTGCHATGARAHALEDRLQDLRAEVASAGDHLPAPWTAFQHAFDQLVEGIDTLRAPGAPIVTGSGAAQPLPLPVPPLPPVLPAVPPLPQASAASPLASPGASLPLGPVPEGGGYPGTASGPAAPAGAAPAAAATPVLGPAADLAQAQLRLRVEQLDRMATSAGEAGIARARADSEVQQLKRGLGDLVENIQRLKSQLRDIEILGEQALPAGQGTAAAPAGFDPLEMDRYSRLQELTRSLAEGIDDVQTLHHGLKRSVDEVEMALRQQGRVVRDLQQDLLRARMVPFASIAERLQRTVRLAGQDAGRPLDLQLLGAQHEVDRAVLERLVAPLEHLLRNAAAHAIEPAGVRQAAGKPATGSLRIVVTPGDHELQVVVADDGCGIDLARVEAHAVAQGLLPPPEVAPVRLPPGELLQLIFRSGFSTAPELSRVAGRGVGLDVVRTEVLGLGGRIHVDTRAGQGTEFTLVIPVTLATVQAVVVRAGEAWFAVPAPLVEQIRTVNRAQFAELHSERAAHWQGLRYPLASLRRVLGQVDGQVHEVPGGRPLLFLRSADRRCALYVDELAGTQELVVKGVSPHLARLPGVAGASVLGNGRIVLILDPVPLAVGQDGLVAPTLQPPAVLQAQSVVLVVDDALTVRRVTQRVLERAGYQVLLAKDGEEALEMLAAHQPDAMLLDVEMPRMDGFEVMRRVRADALGVQGYLGKPYREEELLALLQQLAVAPARPAT